MAHIQALGYLGFSSSKIEEWRRFSQEILGIDAVSRPDGGLDLRIDDYAWRIRLEANEAKDDLTFVGWEVANAQGLEGLKSDLKVAGVEWWQAEEALIEDRQVCDLIQFQDPDGNLCEAFYGPRVLPDDPFVSPRGAAFVTGEQGLGHVVLVTRNHAEMERFYNDLLDFKLSDYIHTEVVPGRPPIKITFLRCNGRHHSLALAPVSIPAKVAHIMLQVESIDDVGRAMYRAIDEKLHLSFTLGRHANDEMLSFYVMSPSGFDVEYGWGGLTVDDDTWHVKTFRKNSAWGHTFQFPPRTSKPDKSGEAR